MMTRQLTGMQAVTAALAARNSAPRVINWAAQTIATQTAVMIPGAPTSPRLAAASGKAAVTAALQLLVSKNQIAPLPSGTISWRDFPVNVIAEQATIAAHATRAAMVAASPVAFG